METRIAIIGIIIEDTEVTGIINDILHEYSSYIIGRMGIPYRERSVSVISVVLDRRDRNEKEEGIFKDTQWEYEKKGY